MPDSWEVEQKYVVSDSSNLLARLATAGFTCVRTEEHTDVYFRHPCRDFRLTDEAFRLRQVGHEGCVTYKGKRLPGVIKTRREIELTVGQADWQQWHEMLELLGFEPLPAVRKQRQVYLPGEAMPQDGVAEQLEKTAMNGIQVLLDEVQQLGSFAEIELIVTEAERMDAAHRQIAELARQLGLNQVQPKSYLSQLLAKLQIE
jgi:adenylate cyclase class 2